MNWNSRHCNILCCFFLLSLLLCCSFKRRCTLPLLLSFNLILYFIQPRLFPPCYDNGRELSMFNEWLEAGYRFRNILVTVNTRSSSIICSHTSCFTGARLNVRPLRHRFILDEFPAHLLAACLVQMLVSLNKLCTDTGSASFARGWESKAVRSCLGNLSHSPPL